MKKDKDCPICNGKEIEDLEELDFDELCFIHSFLLFVEDYGVA